jgi:hypothetical protein
MKKIMFALLVSVMGGSSMYAQSSSDQLHIGVKAGANYSNMYDSQNKEYTADGKIGFAAGAFVSIPIGTYFGIQPELLFSQKGFKATSSILGNDVSLTRTTSYIDVPIFLAVKPSEMVTILVGPQYSFLMKQKDVFSSPITDITTIDDFDNDNIRKNTLCLVTGLDINLNSVVVGARVGWDLFDNNGDGTSTTPRYKNVWAQATVGIRL